MAPAPVAADVGIVAALPLEVGDVIDNLRRRSRKYQAASRCRWSRGGTSREDRCGRDRWQRGVSAARRATQLLVNGHRPSWIISAGFAGALNPTLARNAYRSYPLK